MEQKQPVRYEDLPDLLTVEEAAVYLRIGRSAAYEAIRQNKIKHMRFGRKVIIPKVYLAVDVLLESASS